MGVRRWRRWVGVGGGGAVVVSGLGLRELGPLSARVPATFRAVVGEWFPCVCTLLLVLLFPPHVSHFPLVALLPLSHLLPTSPSPSHPHLSTPPLSPLPFL